MAGIKRVFLIVLDSFGVGELPDAGAYGNSGSNTLKSIYKSKEFSVDNLKKLGFSNIEGLDFLQTIDRPIGAFGKMAEVSKGKDTTTGHWEIAGLISNNPFPTYPDGFPDEILNEFKAQTGRRVLCNKPYSGTQVINDYGEQHLQTGDLIVYTSADSVFQIAAHEKVVPLEELYEYCRIARKILKSEHSVGRVIARPFEGEHPNFKRTANRKDFSLQPSGETILDALFNNSLDVIAVGKIADIFAGRSISKTIITHGNNEGMAATLQLADESFNGLCFVNLVDFDMLFGHRNDIDGYAGAIAEFDSWLPKFLSRLKQDDVLIITADHGCDPGDESTDHTREYVPLLVYGQKIKPENLGIRNSFSDIAATIADWFFINFQTEGTSFADKVTKV